MVLFVGLAESSCLCIFCLLLLLGIIVVDMILAAPSSYLTLLRLGFLMVAQLGGGGGGRKVPAAFNSKTINGNELKFAGVVKDH